MQSSIDPELKEGTDAGTATNPKDSSNSPAGTSTTNPGAPQLGRRMGHGLARSRSGRGARPFSHPHSHGVAGGTKNAGDHSITQFAVMDDENCSALQQITRGGGGLTLASQWKSQFDDSEETDNEWKQGEHLHSPEHKHTSMSQVHLITIDYYYFCYNQLMYASPLQPNFDEGVPEAVNHKDSAVPNHKDSNHNNTPGSAKDKPKSKDTHIELKDKTNVVSSLSYLNLENGAGPSMVEQTLPKVWSNPEISEHIRPGLEPPLIQQAAFDEYTYEVDVARNVASKTRTNDQEKSGKANTDLYRSMPVSQVRIS